MDMQEAAGITMHPSNIRLLKVNPVKFRSKFTLSCRGIRLPPFLSQFGGLRRKISHLSSHATDIRKLCSKIDPQDPQHLL